MRKIIRAKLAIGMLLPSLIAGFTPACHTSEVIPVDELSGGNPVGDSEVNGGEDTEYLLSGCVEDSWETGGSITGAPTIPFSETIVGMVCATDSCRADLSGESDECDLFRLEAASLTQLTVSLNFTHAQGDLDVVLWDAMGNQLGLSAGEVDNEVIESALAFEGGELYIGVCGWNCASNDYALRAELLDPYSGAIDDGDEDCRNNVIWGEEDSWRIGDPVGNWELNGYVDQDGDGAVEIEDVAFSLEGIQCAGYDSAVVLFGDTACPTCKETFEAVAEVQGDLAKNNAALLLLYGDGWQSGSVEVAYDAVSGYGFEGQYITGTIPPVPVVLYPTVAILDIRSGQLIVDNVMSLEQLRNVTASIDEMYP